MPATNYTPIQLYRSTTSGNVPSAANLSAGEIALNIADNDMTMYFENASGTVKRFFNNPAALKYPTADGTSGQIMRTDGAGVLSFAAAPSTALTNNTRQAVTSSATTTINLNSGNVVDLTMAANITTLSFTNVPASGTPILVQIVVRNAASGTAYTIVWPSSVYWSGQYSQLGLPNVQTAPTLATGANGITVIALLTTDGGTKWRGWVEANIPGGTIRQLYSMGMNNIGQLGLGDVGTARSSPTQVGALTDWSIVAGGYRHVVAVKTDGTLWSWGLNNYGQIGINSTVDKSSPTQVGTDTNWSKVAASFNASFAIKTTGSLWSWGTNNSGSLGQNTGGVSNCSSPIQIGALTTWANLLDGSPSSASPNMGAIKTDGTLWVWGAGNYGQLGQNDTVSRSSPVQVGAATDWASGTVGQRCMMVIKTGGALWSWGRNSGYQLGFNDNFNKSSPQQVGALTNWRQVKGFNSLGVAVKTDNTLWSWGFNNYGTNGRGTAGSSSPIQVGALTNWSTIAGGYFHAVAVKTDGTLWSWGRNDYGQLGDNTVINRSSPIQVGALTSWATATTGTQKSTTAVGGLQTVNPA